MYMAMRLFLLYVVVELAVIVALASTIGFGWTVACAARDVRARARAGRLAGRAPHSPAPVRPDHARHGARSGAPTACSSRCGTVLVVIPRPWPAPRLGALLLLPPTRARRPSAGHGDRRAAGAAGRRCHAGYCHRLGYDAAGAATTSTARSSTSPMSSRRRLERQARLSDDPPLNGRVLARPCPTRPRWRCATGWSRGSAATTSAAPSFRRAEIVVDASTVHSSHPGVRRRCASTSPPPGLTLAGLDLRETPPLIGIT